MWASLHLAHSGPAAWDLYTTGERRGRSLCGVLRGACLIAERWPEALPTRVHIDRGEGREGHARKTGLPPHSPPHYRSYQTSTCLYMQTSILARILVWTCVCAKILDRPSLAIPVLHWHRCFGHRANESAGPWPQGRLVTDPDPMFPIHAHAHSFQKHARASGD